MFKIIDFPTVFPSRTVTGLAVAMAGLLAPSPPGLGHLVPAVLQRLGAFWRFHFAFPPGHGRAVDAAVP